MKHEPKTRAIWKTDLTKPLSVLIEEARTSITEVRGRLSDMGSEHQVFKSQLTNVEGLLTCGLIALYNLRADVIKSEVRQLDNQRGLSFRFGSRGIGCENGLKCFVCGEGPDLLDNIAAFVDSKDEGEYIVSMFNHAWLDYRPHEPKWIQVKVGVCEKHKHNLVYLDKLVSVYGRIRKADIIEAVNHVEEEKVE